MADLIELGSFDDLSALAEADWIIEAIVEEESAKRELLARLEAEVGERAVVSSNTSGLSIAQLIRGEKDGFFPAVFGRSLL